MECILHPSATIFIIAYRDPSNCRGRCGLRRGQGLGRVILRREQIFEGYACLLGNQGHTRLLPLPLFGKALSVAFSATLSATLSMAFDPALGKALDPAHSAAHSSCLGLYFRSPFLSLFQGPKYHVHTSLCQYGKHPVDDNGQIHEARRRF